MQGLAQSMAGSPVQQPTQQVDPAMLEKIIMALLDGVDPEELVKQGVPPEVIMQAIEIIEEQMASQEQQQQPQSQSSGLAQSMAQM